jgi:hypothetical protein
MCYNVGERMFAVGGAVCTVTENVIILGAGASVDAGAPLMTNFFDVAEDLFVKNRDRIVHPEAFETIFRLISELQSVYAKSHLDLNNIEALFGAVEMAGILGRLGTRSENEIKEIRDSLVQVIVETLELSMGFPVTEQYPLNPPGSPPIYRISPTESYLQLAKVLNQRRNTTVISFNYDLGLDYALNYIGASVDYGLEDEIADEKVPLLKLHGSLNWARCTDESCRKIIPYTMEQYFGDLSTFIEREMAENWRIAQRTYNLRVSKHFTRQVHCQHGGVLWGVGPTPVIVPPSWNKTDYQGTLVNVWKKASDALANARHIYVVGYSLPESDSFFRYLFALGTLSTTRLRSFWVFNPDERSSTIERYKRMLGPGIIDRFRYIPQKFDQFTKDAGQLLST